MRVGNLGVTGLKQLFGMIQEKKKKKSRDMRGSP
jgi:hypothetical protein